MAQLDSNGIATHTTDMSELPFGNYVVRGTYPENTYYKSSTGTAVIHHYPTNADERTCHEAEHFCEYTPSTYTRGEAGENITEDQLCAVADNQFIVADMKNSTSMEVLIGILEGQQTELENTRIYLLHGPDLQVYCEKDATDGYLHIHYTHPDNPAYANINVATTLDFTDANKFTFTIDDGGCCTLRVWNQNSNGDGTWSTTLDYTYTFPSEYVLQPDDVWATSTGVYTTSRVLVEGIDYEYTYAPHIAVNCKDNTGWYKEDWSQNKDTKTPADKDNYGYVTDTTKQPDGISNDSYSRWWSYYDSPLAPSMKIEVTLENRGTYGFLGFLGLLDLRNKTGKVNTQQLTRPGFAIQHANLDSNTHLPKDMWMLEKHGTDGYTSTSLNTPYIHEMVRAVFVITQAGYIQYSDNLGHNCTSAEPFTREDLGYMRFAWQTKYSTYTKDMVSITSLRIYTEYTP